MATRIQSVWRMHVMRKYFAMLFKEMTAGAITVQRVFRGMLVRVYGCMCVFACGCVAVCCRQLGSVLAMPRLPHH